MQPDQSATLRGRSRLSMGSHPDERRRGQEKGPGPRAPALSKTACQCAVTGLTSTAVVTAGSLRRTAARARKASKTRAINTAMVATVMTMAA